VPGITAFYDASVLYGSTLRNLLMHLALTGIVRDVPGAGLSGALEPTAFEERL